jgi:hypothetical protein
VIFSITFFGGLFGVVGMIVGVPIFAIFYAAVRAIVSAMLENKDLPTETAQYENIDYIDKAGFHETIPKAKRSHGNQKNIPEETSDKEEDTTK